MKVPDKIVWVVGSNPTDGQPKMLTIEEVGTDNRRHAYGFYDGHQWRYTGDDMLVEEDERYRVVAWAEDIILEPLEEHASRVTFGQAIEALKLGRKVTRAGWNGKGMYLWLLPAAAVKAEWCREPHLKAVAEANGGEIECLGSIRMYTADKKVLTGWLASQTDMLAEDWRILE